MLSLDKPGSFQSKRLSRRSCHSLYAVSLSVLTLLAASMIRRPLSCAAFVRPCHRQAHSVSSSVMSRPKAASSSLASYSNYCFLPKTYATRRRAFHASRTDEAVTATRPMASLKFDDTPLGQNGTHLLDGLDMYTVQSNDDGHPLAVYGISSTNPVQKSSAQSTTSPSPPLKPILLLHGRTWSSVPVYHLLGGNGKENEENLSAARSNGDDNTDERQSFYESRSLMEALLQRGLQPYCMDFRGFGGTPKDDTGCVTPNCCVQDAESVLQWIAARHGIDNETTTDLPSLLGWSQGALVAQLAAQKNHPACSKVILYGSIYDPLVRYPREPLYLSNPRNNSVIHNHYDSAIEDFTVEGTIPPEPARRFAEAALLSDPIKAVWKNLYQFNNCDPARVHVPCCVVAGDQDPYAPLHVQQELFCNLGRSSDRTWSIVAGSDHACHLLDGRFRLINTIVSFVMNGQQPRMSQ